jgi:hypothetical protein
MSVTGPSSDVLVSVCIYSPGLLCISGYHFNSKRKKAKEWGERQWIRGGITDFENNTMGGDGASPLHQYPLSFGLLILKQRIVPN